MGKQHAARDMDLDIFRSRSARTRRGQHAARYLERYSTPEVTTAKATRRAGLGNFSASEVTTAMATRSVVNEKIMASEVITALSTRCGCIDDEEAIRPDGIDLMLTSIPTAPVTYVDVTSALFCDFQRYFRGVLLSSSIPPSCFGCLSDLIKCRVWDYPGQTYNRSMTQSGQG